jgi:predicted RNA-binding Zn-ribbon protein involved in translation (DUF1610 family)
MSDYDEGDVPEAIEIGQDVFDAEGNSVGTIRGWDEDGFFVTTREGIDALSVEHEHTTPGSGTAELMWRCSDCGEMGDIHDLPEECPDCGAERERLFYWTED